ncbi:MAG TPA: DsbC family protein [Burkholderiales bacterium]|nr:DsbC family protein [Burkholderiales bacterium]
MNLIVRLALCTLLCAAATATAGEAEIRQTLQSRYPDLHIENVARSPIPGVYEIYADGEILYVDEKASYLIVGGKLVDTARKADVTSERLRSLSAVKFEQLPLDLAFRKVRGDGSRKIAYFTDPNCPYCRKLEPDLEKLDNVTIYFFLYPVLGKDSHEKAQAVWCSKDRSKTWDDWMLRRKTPPAVAACDTPIEKIIAFGRRKGITGTPTLFLANGERVRGAIPFEQLKQLVDSAR